MGIDLIIVARNSNQVTKSDFDRLKSKGSYPDTSESAYHWIEFFKDYIIISDGCRFHLSHEYKIKLIDSLEKFAGSQPKISGDDFFENNDEIIKSFEDTNSNLWKSKNELIEIIQHDQEFTSKWNRIKYSALREHYYSGKTSPLYKKIDQSMKDLYEMAACKWPRYPQVFVSYSLEDTIFVKDLKKRLQQKGVNIWVASGEIKVGDSLIEKIREGLNTSSYVIAVLSETSINSNWVKKELDIAMTQEIEGETVKVLPVLIDECELPGFLKGKYYADCTNPDNINDTCVKIIDRLKESQLPHSFF